MSRSLTEALAAHEAGDVTTRVVNGFFSVLPFAATWQYPGALADAAGRLDPALARFEALDNDTQNEFRDLLGRFVSLYGFVAQIVNFTDEKLERDYIYCRALQARLPGQEIGRAHV